MQHATARIAVVDTPAATRLRLRSLVALFVALLVAPAVPRVMRAQQVGRTPVEVNVAPVHAMRALGRVTLAYELQVTNMGSAPIRFDALEVRDDAQRLVERVEGARLAQRVSVVGVSPMRPTDAPTLASGHRSIVYLYITLPVNSNAPLALTHRLLLTADESETDTLLLAPVRVVPTSDETLAAPVRGGPWVALRASSATSAHRLSVVTLNGVTRVPQRHAVDWAKVGPNGTLSQGDSTVLSSWWSYGDTVFAVANGRVVTARDGAPDTPPLTAPVGAWITAPAATGNVLVVQLPDGRYASYAHLQPGSLRVKVGDTVREGQSLARIGNSGNSFAPHLHFQLGDGAELLASEGLPFALREFELVGRLNSLPALLGGTPWTPLPSQPARMVRSESLLENMIVRIPAAARAQGRAVPGRK